MRPNNMTLIGTQRGQSAGGHTGSSLSIDIGQAAAAVAMCGDVADFLGEHFETTWLSLCNAMPDAKSLLETPAGWGVLAGYIANDLGLGPVDYHPAVH